MKSYISLKANVLDIFQDAMYIVIIFNESCKELK